MNGGGTNRIVSCRIVSCICATLAGCWIAVDSDEPDSSAGQLLDRSLPGLLAQLVVDDMDPVRSLGLVAVALGTDGVRAVRRSSTHQVFVVRLPLLDRSRCS